jgi:divalent metal cation (Fe/Co/Zn/Cd) transporter
VDALLDRAPKGLAERFVQSVGEIGGIRRVSHIRVRDVGSQVFVDLTVDVPRYLSFEESHQLAQKAQDALRRISPNADVVVHADPVAESEGVLERIQAVAAREHLFIHNVTTHWTEKGMWIDLDIEVDPDLSLENAHKRASDFEAKLRSELIHADTAAPVADINAHIEPRGSAFVAGKPLDPGKADAYLERIQAIGCELRGSGGCHNIEIHEIGRAVYLSFHLSMDAGISIAEVHRIAEEMEGRLRNDFPELGRVVIHTEPSK